MLKRRQRVANRFLGSCDQEEQGMNDCGINLPPLHNHKCEEINTLCIRKHCSGFFGIVPKL